ncbi:hypothetical protein N657DRAFT_641326 [Parathielavia appendiculata]|uniref:Uncharacterized protein n=1 Tax=Parathielavia appendiculata TaxID=2587402 RepID=A0AAN6U6F8_9PEZI|nr:hypothetical protein N657DRAFT_641326 [Parathielavia appendiculata]
MGIANHEVSAKSCLRSIWERWEHRMLCHGPHHEPYSWAIGGRDTVDFMAKRPDSQQREDIWRAGDSDWNLELPSLKDQSVGQVVYARYCVRRCRCRHPSIWDSSKRLR